MIRCHASEYSCITKIVLKTDCMKYHRLTVDEVDKVDDNEHSIYFGNCVSPSILLQQDRRVSYPECLPFLVGLTRYLRSWLLIIRSTNKCIWVSTVSAFLMFFFCRWIYNGAGLHMENLTDDPSRGDFEKSSSVLPTVHIRTLLT